jgi:predicted transposase/invertase (TIGR01784 family)
MDEKVLYEKIKNLPQELQRNVEDYVDFLIDKYQKEPKEPPYLSKEWFALKAQRDNYSLMQTAKNQASEEGKKEVSIKTARVLKEDGYSVENIANLTGLSNEQIDQL